jgi:hypothetical protein
MVCGASQFRHNVTEALAAGTSPPPPTSNEMAAGRRRACVSGSHEHRGGSRTLFFRRFNDPLNGNGIAKDLDGTTRRNPFAPLDHGQLARSSMGTPRAPTRTPD